METPFCCCEKTGLSFTTGFLETPVGKVWRIDNDWKSSDWIGALRMRLGIGRMNYVVSPGLYASGNPTAESPVMVTSNYKLTIDHLRRAIKGIDAWMLVLDTNGVNVWCAAGKGTFGTGELVSRIAGCRLSELVTHRTLIVPQLGATGVAAHEVLAVSGFKVVYGPVRANALPQFMVAGMKATKDMRTVTFNLAERLAVVPVEVVHWAKWLLALFAVCSVAAAVGSGNYGLFNLVKSGLCLVIAFMGGSLLGPVLFPWLPGRAFAVKGVFSGLLALGIMFPAGLLPVKNSVDALQSSGWILLTLSISSFLMLAYTGSSPYTSLSGTRIETRIGFRLQCVAAVAGILLLLLPSLLYSIRLKFQPYRV
ncbi:MAG: mercury methylation corrinoid protein HgcA [Victivallaceae bacterium]|nr:mercury methylation corrinoid protein HgcA [Victivallaceae bacterium]